jgi:murein DD-endopeptidase MepM/ murein hydrolase activator NlpD
LAASQRTVVSLLDSVHALGAAAERAMHLPPRNMVMPVVGEITSPFSMSRLHPILGIFREHRGVDIAAPRGTPIVATAPGRVRSVGWRLDYGLTVEIEHTGEIATRYAHCTKSLVRVGDVVNAGDTIATVGTTGLATGPHVHFEVIDHGTAVDPIQFLARSREAAAAATTEPAQGGQ